MAKKKIRKSIRIHGQPVQERFLTKTDAENWYREMSNKKTFMKHGLKLPLRATPTVMEYSINWFKKRQESHPQATWDSDERRLRLHVLPAIGDVPIGQVGTKVVKHLLLDAKRVKSSRRVLVNGEEKWVIKYSDAPVAHPTREKIRSLLSTIFTAAKNEDPPLIENNPAAHIVFDEGRRAKSKRPIYLDTAADCLKFIKLAKELGDTPYVAACIFLMAGLRKSEATALQWSQVNFKTKIISVSHIIEQTSMLRIERTKAGEEDSRDVPMSEELEHRLRYWKAATKFSRPDDFVLCDHRGQFLRPHALNRFFKKLYEAMGKPISPHRLRHTFGSQFAANSGNLRALQRILGHSTITTTEVYSQMSGRQVLPFKDVVRYGGHGGRND